MKRFLLIFAFLLSIMVANAQIYTYRSYAFAEKNVGYAWSDFVQSNLTITINLDTDIIRIYNKQKSCFFVLSSRQYYDSDGELILECYCYDEEHIRCTIRLVIRNSGTSQLYVDYANFSICYNIVRTN